MSKDSIRVFLVLAFFIFTVFLSLGDRQIQIKEARLGLNNDILSKGLSSTGLLFKIPASDHRPHNVC